MTRQKKLLLNTTSSFIYQITTVICGLILPRVILESYGSKVNGLVGSISQFLGIITFLEMGVGAVIQSALYGPLAKKDNSKISAIIASGSKFFRRLAIILLCYTVFLVFMYPHINQSGFSWGYTAVLICAMAVSSFFQFYFGLIDQLFLSSDQRGYVQCITQTATIILNTVACCILIYSGASIQIVKLSTSLIYLIRPLVYRLYICKNYSINRKIKYEGEPIKQKWNGVAQHLAAVILNDTDVIVLTIFSTIESVSIYSIYNMVVIAIKQLVMSITNGIGPLLGELWAKKQNEELKKIFAWQEWSIHTATTFAFACTFSLIVPFVKVYTNEISDAQYIQPIFAAILVVAISMNCYRLPYLNMILSVGHYRQTQNVFIIGAVINIVVSVLTVKMWGLVGVAIGTFIALFYQTVCLAIYNVKNLIRWPAKKVILQFTVDIVIFTLITIVSKFFVLNSISYLSWFVLACKVAVFAICIIIVINLLFYRDMVVFLIKQIKNKIIGKKNNK